MVVPLRTSTPRNTASYVFDYNNGGDVTAAAKLFASTSQLQVEKSSFEHALSSGGAVQPKLSDHESRSKWESATEVSPPWSCMIAWISEGFHAFR